MNLIVLKINLIREQFILLVSGGKENAFICIEGNIDLKSLSKLSKSMNIQGMKALENVNSNTKK